MAEKQRAKAERIGPRRAGDFWARAAGTIMIGGALALLIASRVEVRRGAEISANIARQPKSRVVREDPLTAAARAQPESVKEISTPKAASSLIRWEADGSQGEGKTLSDYFVRVRAIGGYRYYIVESFPQLSTADKRRMIDFLARERLAAREGLQIAFRQGIRSTAPEVLPFVAGATASVYAEMEAHFADKIDTGKLTRLVELQYAGDALDSAGLFHDFNFYGLNPSPPAIMALLEGFHSAGVTFPEVDAKLRRRMMEPADEASGLKPVILEVIAKAGPALTPQQIQVLKNFSRRYE